ncbi:hypothetical protein LINPERHAP1_LOCUS4267, partial [Linum perenne]
MQSINLLWGGVIRLNGKDFWNVKASTGSWNWKRLLKLRPLAAKVFSVQGSLVYSNGKPMENYKIRTVWEQLRPKAVEVDWYSSVWTGFILPSNSFIVWLIMKGKLATKD